MKGEQLINCPLFKGLTADEINRELENSVYQIRRYKKGDMVALAGQRCEQVMILVSGRVQGQMVDQSGKLITIEEMVAPQPIATAFVYATENLLPVNIEALENTELLFIPKDAFADVLQNNRIMLFNFLRVVSNRSKFLSQKIQFLSFKSLRNKLADFIVHKVNQNGNLMVEFTKTQQELADYFGVARPSLARALAEMEAEGLISLSRKTIVVHRLNELKALSK